MRSRTLLVGLCLALGITVIKAGSAISMEAPAELIERAEADYADRYEPATLTRMIELYEEAFPHLDELRAERQRSALNRMAQLYYERAVLRQKAGEDNHEDLARSKELGFRRMRMNDGFAQWENRDLAQALTHIEDPAPLLWTANAWGQIFSTNPFEGLANVGKVLAMYERCIEIDASFWGGNCVHALGAMLVTTPGPFGGDFERGRELLNRAVEVNPDYLVNRIVRAEYLGFTYNALGSKNGIRDRELIERELQTVEEAPIGDWPFWNRIAKRDVERLREELQRFTSN